MQAITVCVDYADILKWTLPANYHQFDRMIVVTEERDVDTIALCNYYDVECIKKEGNKGQKINAALDRMDGGWTLQLDADIYLPPQTIRMIKGLDEETLYGIDRCLCEDYDQFIDYLSARRPPYPEKFFTQMPFPTAPRVTQPYGNGYYPIGFFQLWHRLGSGVFTYNENHGYSRADMLFCDRFKKKALIPEVIGIHLEQGRGAMGANWNGRTTPTFGPYVPTDTEDHTLTL